MINNRRSLLLSLSTLPFFFNFCNTDNSGRNYKSLSIPSKDSVAFHESDSGRAGNQVVEKTRKIALVHSVSNQAPNLSAGKKPAGKSGKAVADGYHIVNSLPAGYVKNGSVDYTSYIQQALNEHSEVVFPAFPLLINDSGLSIASNKTLNFLKGGELWLKPSVKKSYSIINLRDVSNVTINNIVIKGDRYSHLGTEGEFGMGISIRGSDNIKINGARITECWGDGIYIGQTRNNSVSRRISIIDAYLKKNRRDGISIISVDGLSLINTYAGYHDGTSPMCGINFETNNPNCEINNVSVLNPRTEYNKGNGIQLGMRHLLGGGLKNVNVRLINHVDIGSGSYALKIGCNRKAGVYGGSVSGLIQIINPLWAATVSERPFLFTTDQDGLKVIVSSAEVKNSSGIKFNNEETGRLLNKYVKGNFQYSE